MSLKVSISCALLCLLSLCGGHENTNQELTAYGDVSNETLVSDSNDTMIEDIDLDPDASIWSIWRRFRNWGNAMFHKKFTRSPTMKENDDGRRHFHRDGRKIKNKIKFLFKLKQFET